MNETKLEVNKNEEPKKNSILQEQFRSTKKVTILFASDINIR